MMLFLAEDDLVIKDQIHLENGLAVVIAVCLLLAVVLVALVVWLFPPRPQAPKKNHPAGFSSGGLLWSGWPGRAGSPQK